MKYVIEQHTGYQWEPIPNGGFDSEEDAITAMEQLERELGWCDLRVTESNR